MSESTRRTSNRHGHIPNWLRDKLHDNGVFPRTRPLYAHQAESLDKTRAFADGSLPGVVITAGTGAGKTNSFLLPMFCLLGNDAWGDRRAGMSALVLYP